MATEVNTPHPGRRLAAIADRQHGLITAAQLGAIGIRSKGIAARVADGRLRRIHRGVYAVGHSRLTPEARRLAAVLACGPGAAASHVTAADMHEIRQSAASEVHVVVTPGTRRARRPGMRIHRTRRLHPTEVGAKAGIPITTVARTLLDLADMLADQPLKRAIDEAEYRGLFDLTDLTAVIERNPGRRGKRVLALAEGPQALTRGQLEARVWEVLRRHGFETPLVNAPIEGYVADFLWPEAKLVLELDGYTAHRTRRAFHHDRLRDRRLKLAGYDTVRVTEAHVADERSLVCDLRALLRSSAG